MFPFKSFQWSSVLIVWVASLPAHAQVAGEAGLPRQVRMDWGYATGSAAERFPSRLSSYLENEKAYVTHARVLDRWKNLAIGLRELTRLNEAGHWSFAVKRLGNSSLNPLGTANDAVSDIAMLWKSPRYSRYRLSKRIQLCSASFYSIGSDEKASWIDPITPIVHIGVRIDGVDELETPSGGGLGELEKDRGISCEPVPILSGEGEAAAVERVQCVRDRFVRHAGYDFFRYNCGGFARDILRASGLGYPALPNLGIGAQGLEERSMAREEALQDASSHCELVIESLRAAIVALEAGALPPDLVQDELSAAIHNGTVSDGAIAQLVASAARGRGAGSRSWLKGVLKSRPVDGHDRDRVLRGLSGEAWSWAQSVLGGASPR